MSIQNRRNLNYKPTKSARPYNKLYESFESILKPIFIDRLSEGKRGDSYVNVPSTEKELDDYFNSDTSQVAILHGLMGSGKSTIIENFHLRSENNGERHTIYLDFQGRHSHLMPSNLDYYKLDQDDRRNVSRQMVTKRINELLNDFLNRYRDYINLNFFDFLSNNFITELPREAILVENDNEKQKILRDFLADEDQTAPVLCFIRYLCEIKKIKQFIIIIDNVDEQPYDIIEGCFYALSDMIYCLMRTRDDDESTRFRAVLACRCHSLEALRNDAEGILPTRGCEEISVSGESILIKIIEKRLEESKNKSSNNQQDESYLLRHGARVINNDPYAFVGNFLKCLSSVSIEKNLFDLFNKNYARSLKNIKYLLQNKYFISYDYSVLSSGEINSNFSLNQVFKALGFGNPAASNLLYYPTQSTVITNLLYWDTYKNETFFLVLKIMKWMSSHIEDSPGYANISVTGCSIERLLITFEENYGVDEDIIKNSIKYCHRNGLIFSETGYTSELTGKERLCLSPKGKVIFNSFFKNSLLLEMFIDDMSVPSESISLLNDRPPVISHKNHPTRQHFLDIINWLNFFLENEKNTHKNLNEKHSNNLLFLFDGHLISEKIALSVKYTYNNYYKPVCRDDDEEKINSFIKLCSSTAYFLNKDVGGLYG